MVESGLERIQKDFGRGLWIAIRGNAREEVQKGMETMIADQETGVYAELDGLDGNAVVRRHAWQPTDVGPDVILATTNQARDRIDEKRYYISNHKCYDRECVKERTKSLIVYLAGLRTYP